MAALAIAAAILAKCAHPADEVSSSSHPSPSASPSPNGPSLRPHPSPTATATANASTSETTTTTRSASHPHRVLHAADPCEPIAHVDVPAGFSTVTADGITVAWDPAIALEATSLAFTTAGLLAQLGQITGTAPRGELTVIVYASLDDLHAKGGAPAWSAGLYDGAVRVPAAPHEDFGVDIRTLRHELVHAQLHAAVGCTSIWLDEGLAQWFENVPPEREWLHMLHDHHMLALGAMQVSTLEDVHADRPEQVYATSLAMVLYAFERGDGVADLVRDRRGPPLELWRRRYPEASDQDLLGSLAHRLFGLPTGPELDAIFEGAVCCKGLGRLDELACHGGPRVPGRKTWVDDTRGLCRVVP